MAKFTVEVTQTVVVELDEAKFDGAFMAEFRKDFLPFGTLEQHAEHIAQLEARGIIAEPFSDPFIEGYGAASEMGINANVTAVHSEAIA